MKILRAIKEGDTREKSEPDQPCLPSPEPYPCLLYFSGIFEKNQTFCSILDPTKTYSTKILELATTNLWCIQHGWCLLENFTTDYYFELFLWNTSNLKKIQLPPFEDIDSNYIGNCILSTSPTAANDQVCSIFLFSLNTTSIFYCQLEDEEWTELDYGDLAMKGIGSLTGKKNLLTNPVYCNGCLYAESAENIMVKFEKVGPRDLQVKSTGVLLPTIPRTSFRHIRKLLESNNELFLIEILHTPDKVIFVAIHNFDFSRGVWKIVESIKDRVFFISDSSVDLPFACQPINPKTEGGCIYIALKDNNFVYIYNIEDNSLMVSHPFSNLPKEWSSSIWFMQDVRMTNLHKEESEKAENIPKKESICGANCLKETGNKDLTEFSLPLDVVELIAKRLTNVFDYFHFRAINRLCNLVAPPVQWRSSSSSAMSSSRFDDLSLSPLLVSLDKDEILTVVHPKDGPKYKYTINLPNVKAHCGISYSIYGWLLSGENIRFPFFFNPFTKEVLPVTNGIQCVRSHSAWKYADCSLLTECDDEIAYLYDMRKYESCLYYEGRFYYLTTNGKLGIILDVGGILGKVIHELGMPQAPCTNHSSSFLVECNGNLLSVFEGPSGKWVQVFRLNESMMTWIKVESLENHMLFVGNTTFSAVANIPGMENKIYFPRYYGQSIVFYSLETNNYHTFANEEVDFHHVREKLNSSWIVPRWH